MGLRKGFTIVELVIGLAILGIVLVVAVQALAQFLRIQTDQEAFTSAQTKLRRVSEVIAQDVRGSIFGGLVNVPRVSDSSGFSVALIAGGVGYQVLPYAATSATSIQAIGSPMFGGTDRAFLYAGGQGVVLPLSSAPSVSGNTFTLSFSGCGATVPFAGSSATAGSSNSTLVFPVRAAAYWLDSASQTLRYQENGQAAQDLAYNITQFEVEYIYSDGAGNFATNPGGYNAGGAVRMSLASGWTLSGLRVTLSARERSFGGFKTRTFSNEISLASNGVLELNQVVSCT